MRFSRRETPLLAQWLSPTARGKVVRPLPSWSIGRPNPGNCLVVLGMVNDGDSEEVGVFVDENQRRRVFRFTILRLTAENELSQT
jgi:hypothetical protein